MRILTGAAIGAFVASLVWLASLYARSAAVPTLEVARLTTVLRRSGIFRRDFTIPTMLRSADIDADVPLEWARWLVDEYRRG